MIFLAISGSSTFWNSENPNDTKIRLPKENVTKETCKYL